MSNTSPFSGDRWAGNQSQYLGGEESFALAIALHRTLGWSTVGLFSDESTICHALVRDFSGMHFDIRGYIPYDEIGKPFRIRTQSCNLRSVDPNDLLKSKGVDSVKIGGAFLLAHEIWHDQLDWQIPKLEARISAWLYGKKFLCKRS
ncbi:hypothetical protein KTR10_03070 [Candidatus Kaiserbacteria bacterium]|nr:hypothetical protein [Candidatus Kaiserbacteria bacterium]